MTSSAKHRLRCARSCYDHLAGRLGVGVTEALERMHALTVESGSFTVTARGERLFKEIGVDLDAVRTGRRRFARTCLDWTERRPHLAGALGAALLASFIRNEWVRRDPRDRSLHVTERGRRDLPGVFGLAV